MGEDWVNRSELIIALNARFPKLDEQETAFSIEVILDKIAQHLSDNGRIEIRGFGAFSLRHHKARAAHNPLTRQRFIAEPKSAIHFKPGKSLRERLKNTTGNALK